MRIENRFYEDAFEISDTNDLLNYLLSSVFLKSGESVEREVIFDMFDKKKDQNGIIRIPKEQGTFIAIK